jgi:uncharacterized membrane protein
MRSIVLIILLAIALRFVALTFDGFWLDEGYQTIVESYGSALPDLSHLDGTAILLKPAKPAGPKAVMDNFRKVDPLCPPLFALTMNRWITAFGGSDFAIRSMAAVFSVLSILVTYYLGSRLFNRRIALCAALLQTISPFDISYAQEARMYTMVVLFAAISGGATALICIRPQRAKTALYVGIYILSTWALVNTHYTGLFVWAFEIAVGFLVACLRKDWLLLAWWLVANILLAALCAPWYPLFQQAAAIRTEAFYIKRTATVFWPVWAILIRLPLNWLIFLAGKKVWFFSAPIYLSALLILFSGFQSLWRSYKHKYLSLVLLAWCLLPALAVCFLDILESHRVIEIPRYLIGTAPAVYLIAGLGLSTLLQTGKPGYYLLVFHAIFALANTAYAHVISQREDWRQVASILSPICGTNEVVLVSQYYDILCLDRYLDKPLRQIGVSPAMGADKIKELIEHQLGSPETLWVLAAQEGDGVFKMVPPQYSVSAAYDLPHALHLRHYKHLSL